MQKNKKQLNNVNTPAWFDGSNINEAAFCDEFLHTHKIIFANNAFFTPEGGLLMICPTVGRYLTG